MLVMVLKFIVMFVWVISDLCVVNVVLVLVIGCFFSEVDVGQLLFVNCDMILFFWFIVIRGGSVGLMVSVVVRVCSLGFVVGMLGFIRMNLLMFDCMYDWRIVGLVFVI